VETRVARWYIFKTKNPNLGTFFSVLQGKMLVKFMAIWSILLPFRIFCGHFGIFYPFWYVAPRKIWQPWLIRLFRQHPKVQVRVTVLGEFSPNE
jgi:hypothetical protein